MSLSLRTLCNPPNKTPCVTPALLSLLQLLCSLVLSSSSPSFCKSCCFPLRCPVCFCILWKRFPAHSQKINPGPVGRVPSLFPFHSLRRPGQRKEGYRSEEEERRGWYCAWDYGMRGGKEGWEEVRRRSGEGQRERRGLGPFSLQTASSPMRQRVLPALISSKAQSEREQERERRRKR